jgi:Protein of unknown function (DUF4199)
MEALRKNAINYGMFLGLFLIVIYTIVYAVDISLFTNSWVGIINMMVITGFGIYATTKFKKGNANFISFKEAFSSFIITVIIGSLIYTLFFIVLLNFIDTEAKTIITDNVIKYTVDMMQKFGGKAADINKIIKDMKDSDSFGIIGQLKGFAYSIVLYSIIGLITALIIKKEKPQSI